MAAEFDIEGRWPELFEQLDAVQRSASERHRNVVAVPR
ncbi:hypothetical protein ART_2916 [Arthrobacter sp. PAMC 25486]|nr:hypothetical protein ART_2916 [Arthrobacter sp. PAMC 25486]